MAKPDLKSSIQEYFSAEPHRFYEHYCGQGTRKGKNRLFPCPFHADSTASLSTNGDGRWYCHGCKIGGDLFSFYARLKELTSKADFPKVLRGIASDFNLYSGSIQPRQPAKHKQIETVYPYEDSDGNTLFEVVRFRNPKDFRQRRRKKDGQGFVWDIKGVATTLYHLPEVLKSNDVLVVEGEKDVDRLRGLGFTATTNPQGAGKWLDAYTDVLAGKNVTIIPDNDNPGRQHAQTVARALFGKVKDLRVVPIPGVPNGGDISDWLDKQPEDSEKAAETLSQIIDGTPIWEDKPQIEAVEAVEFVETTLDDAEDIVSGLLSPESLLVLGGPNKSNKSNLAYNMATALSRGERFLLQFEIKRKFRVLIIQAEMAAGAMQKRCRKIYNTLGTPPRGQLYMINRRGLKLDNPAHLNQILESCKYYQPEVLFLDPLYKFHGGNENSVKDMTVVFDAIDKIIRQLKCSVVLCHHSIKPAKDEVREGADLLRGSGVIFGYGDSYITITRLKSLGRHHFKLTFNLRNHEEPPPMTVYCGNETLCFEVIEKTSDGSGEPVLGMADVASLLKTKGQLAGTELVLELSLAHNVSKRTCRNAIRRAVAAGYINKKDLGGRGRPKGYFVTRHDQQGNLFEETRGSTKDA